MASKIMVVVEDLIFLSKIQQTAKLLGVAIETASPEQVAVQLDGDVGAVILDLNHRSGRAVELLREMKSDPATRPVAVIGFLSHVQAELARQAREAGCNLLMARSAFTQKLPELLQRYARIKSTPAP
jgi:CheY-like chemotaxis protein